MNFFHTMGGKIHCVQCKAQSKRTKVQCRAPAMRGKQVCRTHGGLSRGATSPEGKQRCIDAVTKHGRETRKVRSERRVKIGELQQLEALGREIGLISGSKTRGPKAKLATTTAKFE